MENAKEIVNFGSSTSTSPSARSSNTRIAAEIKIVSIPKMNAIYFAPKKSASGWKQILAVQVDEYLIIIKYYLIIIK